MTIYMALHLWNDIDRLYVSRKEWRRGLSRTESCVDASTQGLWTTLKESRKIY